MNAPAERILAPSFAIGAACILCSQSCQGWDVAVDPPEKRRIEAAVRERGLRLPSQAGFLREEGGWILKKKGRRCGFLMEDGRCWLHANFGLEIKPSTCRHFPWERYSIPGAVHYTVSLACTATIERLKQGFSVASVASPPVAEAAENGSGRLPAPRITGRHRGTWPEWLEIRDRLLAVIGDTSRPLGEALVAARSLPPLRPAVGGGRRDIAEALELRLSGGEIDPEDQAICRQAAARGPCRSPLAPGSEEELWLRHYAGVKVFVSEPAIRQGFETALYLTALYIGLCRSLAVDLGLSRAILAVEKLFASAAKSDDWLKTLALRGLRGLAD